MNEIRPISASYSNDSCVSGIPLREGCLPAGYHADEVADGVPHIEERGHRMGQGGLTSPQCVGVGVPFASSSSAPPVVGIEREQRMGRIQGRVGSALAVTSSASQINIRNDPTGRSGREQSKSPYAMHELLPDAMHFVFTTNGKKSKIATSNRTHRPTGTITRILQSIRHVAAIRDASSTMTNNRSQPRRSSGSCSESASGYRVTYDGSADLYISSSGSSQESRSSDSGSSNYSDNSQRMTGNQRQSEAYASRGSIATSTTSRSTTCTISSPRRSTRGTPAIITGSAVARHHLANRVRVWQDEEEVMESGGSEYGIRRGWVGMHHGGISQETFCFSW